MEREPENLREELMAPETGENRRKQEERHKLQEKIIIHRGMICPKHTLSLESMLLYQLWSARTKNTPSR